IGFKAPTIQHTIVDDDFNHPGKREHYANISKKLYKGYGISCKDTISKRIKDMGFKVSYDYNNRNIGLDLYHPLDVVPKVLYIKGNNRYQFGIHKIAEKLKNMSKIINYTLNIADDTIIVRRNTNTYTIEKIYEFILKMFRLELEGNICKVELVNDPIDYKAALESGPYIL